MIRTRWAIATLLAGCLLAGCSEDDPEPKIDAKPTPSENTSSTTVTASPTVSPTVTPTAVLGPEETVRAWVDDWNSALHSGETTALRGYEDDTCRGCDELVGPVERIYADGGSFDGGEWAIAVVRELGQSNAGAKVSLGVDVAAGSTVNEAGSEPSTYPATKHLLTFTLVETSEGWKVSVIEVLS